MEMNNPLVVKSPSEEKETRPPKDDVLKDPNGLLYSIDETPPLYLSFLLGFQHFLTMFGATVGIPFVLGRAMCIIDKPTVVSEILSTLIFCSGIVTLLQSTFGVRLPIIQGGTFALIPPALAIMETRNSITTCAAADNTTHINGTSGNHSAGDPNDPEWQIRMRMVQGAILVASCFQVGIGLSGVVGLLLKFIGPLTIVPTITLVALPLFEVAGYYNGSQWGIALLTMVCITLFSQVLERYKIPLCKGITLPVFKLFPVLLSILIGWIVSAILTVSEALEEGSAARTDYRSMVLEDALWFRIPYPGQWGAPTVTVSAVFGMLAGILASMIESIGDYYACARLAGAPPPPVHALNRGIAFEGLGCVITGAMGTGNGTTSYSENIGAIGITRVGSVRVIQCGCAIMILLSVIGKFGAVFVTIPNPVIGAVLTIMFGMITAVGLSALQFVDLSSMRNLFVLGTSIFFGFVLPEWVKKNGKSIDVGDDVVNQIVVVLLQVSMFVGGMTGFLLDNLLPGTREERGIIAWNARGGGDGKVGQRIASEHVYDPPFLTERFMQSKACKYLPFLPYYPPQPPTEETGVVTNGDNPDNNYGYKGV